MTCNSVVRAGANCWPAWSRLTIEDGPKVARPIRIYRRWSNRAQLPPDRDGVRWRRLPRRAGARSVPVAGEHRCAGDGRLDRGAERGDRRLAGRRHRPRSDRRAAGQAGRLPEVRVPFERGGRWFQFRNTGLQDQPALYVADAPGTKAGSCSTRTRWPPTAPSTVSGDRADQGRLAACVRDQREGLGLADLAGPGHRDRRGAARRGRLDQVGNAAWLTDGSGFYYMAPEPPVPGTEYLAESGARRILLHKIGTPQSEDEVVFAEPRAPRVVPGRAGQR